MVLTRKIYKKKHIPKHQIVKKKRNKHHHHITIQEDFYSMVNKDWIDRHKNQVSKKTIISAFSLLNNKVDKDIKNVVLNKLIGNAQVNALYHSYMEQNDPLVEKHIFSLIIELIQIQDSKEANDLYKLMSWSIQKGLNQLVNIVISADQRQPTLNRFYIEEGGLNIEDPEKYRIKDKKIINKYRKLLTDMFHCIFGPDHSYDIEKVIEIEKYMSQFIYSSKEPRTIEKIYNLFSVSQSKKICHLDWTILSKDIELQETPKEIVIENPRYTREAMLLLNSKWRTNDMLVYYITQILFMASKFHSKLHQIILDYCIIDKKVKLATKQDRAINFICEIMNTLVNKTYLKFYENKREIVLTKHIIQLIIATYITRLKRNTWLSSDTIRIAIDKLENLKVTVGDKPYWIEDPSCVFLMNDVFANYMRYLEWKLHYFVKTFYKPIPSKNTWLKGIDMNTYNVNAEYNMNKNEIIIPNAILQAPFLDISRPLSYNMATMGTLIGHEISHGFDNIGSLYDKHGSYHNCWKKEDFQAYASKQILIKTFFYRVAKRDKFNVNPEMTLSENIADITGFLVAEEAYINVLTENCVYGLKQREHLKHFYTNYAQLWRVVMHPKLMSSLYKRDNHSYAKYRVNCALVMSPHFQALFGGLKTDNPQIAVW